MNNNKDNQYKGLNDDTLETDTNRESVTEMDEELKDDENEFD